MVTLRLMCAEEFNSYRNVFLTEYTQDLSANNAYEFTDTGEMTDR